MSLLRKEFCCLIFFLILAVAGCGGNSDNKENNSGVSTHFAIILVKGVQTKDAMKTKLEDLPLETQPVLTDKDLISYKWKEHELELRQDFEFNESLKNVSLDGLPFVVIADDKRVYLGAFWTALSSGSTSIPVIEVLSPNISKNIIIIKDGYPGKTVGKTDLRSNQLVYNALESIGKIKD